MEDLQDAIITINPDADTQALLELYFRLKAYIERGRDMKLMLEEKLVENLSANGPVMVGDVQYRAGVKKTTKCMNLPGAVQALLESVGGDFDAFCQCLSSNAIKYGAAREPLGERWDEFFKVEEQLELVEGKAKKSLIEVNTKFLR